jgi:hypothetical protein
MKSFHIPRALVILFLVVVVGIFLAGSLLAFQIVGAAASNTPTPTAKLQSGNDAEATPEPVATPALMSADTTGIIALAILIVIIVLVGAVLGGRWPRRKTPL